MEPIKTCDNCAYSTDKFVNHGKCLRTGWFCDIQRSYPDARCDSNFSGWVPKKKNWIQRLFSGEVAE